MSFQRNGTASREIDYLWLMSYNLIRSFSSLCALWLLLYFAIGCHFPQKAEDIKPKRPDTAAFENARFGMTAEEFVSKVKDTVVIINDGLFYLKPFFIPGDHRMYMLQIRSGEIAYDKFDTDGKTEMNALVDQYTALYGNPGIWFKHPRLDDIEQGQVSWACKWTYPNKEIRIGMARLRDKKVFLSENRFVIAVCEIVNKPLLKIANEQIVYTGVLQ